MEQTGEVLEIACLVAIESRDTPFFERNIAQLKAYYIDYRCERHKVIFIDRVRADGVTIVIGRGCILLWREHSAKMPESQRKWPLLGLNLLRLLSQNKYGLALTCTGNNRRRCLCCC